MHHKGLLQVEASTPWITNRILSSRIAKIDRSKTVCVALPAMMEFYKNSKAMEPEYIVLYSQVKQLESQPTGFNFITSTHLFTAYIPFHNDQYIKFYEYLVYRLSQSSASRTPVTPLDFTPFFTPLQLKWQNPDYNFDYDRFMAEETERKRAEEARKKEEEE